MWHQKIAQVAREKRAQAASELALPRVPLASPAGLILLLAPMAVLLLAAVLQRARVSAAAPLWALARRVNGRFATARVAGWRVLPLAMGVQPERPALSFARNAALELAPRVPGETAVVAAMCAARAAGCAPARFALPARPRSCCRHRWPAVGRLAAAAALSVLAPPTIPGPTPAIGLVAVLPAAPSWPVQLRTAPVGRRPLRHSQAERTSLVPASRRHAPATLASQIEFLSTCFAQLAPLAAATVLMAGVAVRAVPDEAFDA